MKKLKYGVCGVLIASTLWFVVGWSVMLWGHLDSSSEGIVLAFALVVAAFVGFVIGIVLGPKEPSRPPRLTLSADSILFRLERWSTATDEDDVSGSKEY